MQQWYFLSHMKSQADWDTCYGRRPSTTVWSIGGEVSASCFPTTPTNSCITITRTSPSSRLAYLTRVWMHLLGSIHTLLNPYTRELLYLSSSPRSALPSSLHLSWPLGCERCKMEIKNLTGMLVFGEGLQDWVL